MTQEAVANEDPDVILPPPLDPQPAQTVDRFCDLVMQGGVVDGVIYPWAILELARHYRFQSLAGTSVGAMAAALTAAAEYGRRKGWAAGFDEVLRKLPRELAKTQPDGNTKLFSLFQPFAKGQKLFNVFVAAAQAPDGRWLGAGVVALLNAYFGVILWVYAAFSAFHLLSQGSVLHDAWALGLGADSSLKCQIGVWTLVALLAPLKTWCSLFFASILALALVIYRDLQQGLVANNYGLCPGSYPEGKVQGPVPLMDWLHEGIQAAAGRPLNQPLTFEDLWTAPGGPDMGPESANARKLKPRSIDLRVMSTNLNHGRPYQFPLHPDSERLYFDPLAWRSHFPAEVLAYLHSKDCARPYHPEQANDPALPDGVKDLRELPHGRLPILVAARLSLSFPVLFSTVPLWAIEKRPDGSQRFRPCHFTDGGVCSNFPIHVFDSVVPEWPTFGITLENAAARGRSEKVWVTQVVTEGGEDVWSPLDSQGPDAGIGKFARRLISTMMGWSDDTTQRLPGVRDRIVHVCQVSDQSLNLKLSGPEIMTMARELGQPAGQALVNKFLSPVTGQPSEHWHEHRWVRFQTFLSGIRQRLHGLRWAASGAGGNPSLQSQISASTTRSPVLAPPPGQPPLADSLPLTKHQAESLSTALQALQQLEQSLAEHDVQQPLSMVPGPELHLRPPV